MNSFIPIFSAFFILLGLLVWRFPKLIAGYNTMTPEQQKKVDVKGLKAFMCRVFCAIGILVFVSYLLLRLFMDEASAINISSIVVPIIGVIYPHIREAAHRGQCAPYTSSRLPFRRGKAVRCLLPVLTPAYGLQTPASHAALYRTCCYSTQHPAGSFSSI